MAVVTQSVKDYVKPVREIEKEIKDHKFRIDACELGEPDLKIRKVLSNAEKGSSSPSIICFGKLAAQDVAIKISFKSKGEINDLDVELQIYEGIVPEMLVHTPHLLGVDLVRRCSEDWNPGKVLPVSIQGRNDIPKRLQEETDYINKEFPDEYNMNSAAFLITELAPGKSKTLKDFIEAPGKRSYDTFYKPILAQIAYTLLVFWTYGIMHNDMHGNNVFIDEVDTPIRIVYDVQGKKYELITKYFVRLYDFDHSSKTPTGRSRQSIENTLLTTGGLCQRYGDCNEYLSSWDWAELLVYIAFYTYEKNHGNENNDEWKWLQDIVPLQYLQTQMQAVNYNAPYKGKWAYLGRTCQCKDEKCTECTKGLDMLKYYVKTPAMFIYKNLTLLPEDTVADYSLFLPGEVK